MAALVAIITSAAAPASLAATQATCLPTPSVSECFDTGRGAIELRLSGRYEAITFRGADGKPHEPVIAEVDALDESLRVRGFSPVLRFPSLLKAGVVIARKEPGLTGDLLRKLIPRRAVIGADAEGNPVYESGSVDRVVLSRWLWAGPPGDSPAAAGSQLGSLDGFGVDVVDRPSPGAPRGPWRVAPSGLSPRNVLKYALGHSQADANRCLQAEFITIAETVSESGTAPVDRCVTHPARDGLDPLYRDQWFFFEHPGGVNAEKAWALANGRRDIVVAVLDDGIERDHPDLQPSVIGAWNAVKDTDDLQLTPWDYHGTAVAGLIASTAGNTVGGRGMASGVGVFAVRVIEWAERGGGYAISDFSIIRGIDHASSRAQVLNASWTLGNKAGEGVPCVTESIDRALSAGVTMVFGAGNAPVENLDFPASLATSRPIIVVGATDRDNNFRVGGADETGVTWGSAYGPQVTLAAPGVNMVTTDASGPRGACPTGDYAWFLGTSAAAPLVAGIAGLVQSRRRDLERPLLSPPDMKALLIRSVMPLAEKTRDPGSRGAGRIDACYALEAENCDF